MTGWRSDPTTTADSGSGALSLTWALRAAGGETLRVLVAEPRPALRRQIGLALRRAGIDVDFADTAEEALRLAARQQYHAAVVDPDMDSRRGFALCALLARGGRGPRMPVIVLGESAGLGARLRSRLAGARLHLVRPVLLERFVGAVIEHSLQPSPRPRLEHAASLS